MANYENTQITFLKHSFVVDTQVTFLKHLFVVDFEYAFVCWSISRSNNSEEFWKITLFTLIFKEIFDEVR